MKTIAPLVSVTLTMMVTARVCGEETAEEFSKRAAELRSGAVQKKIEPKVSVPRQPLLGSFAWKTDIVTTVFWVGGSDNAKSAWDANWKENFGGVDSPESEQRQDFHPRAFVPRLNPFYCALPYNDVTEVATKPEASKVIPWFHRDFVREGASVCRGYWLSIRNPRNGRIAYAQWNDVGPHGSDQFEYVFGNKRPNKNPNHGAGLGVSPAVRDYLGLSSTDVTDWRFVEVREVPKGPWQKWGEDNPFVQRRTQGDVFPKLEE